MIRTIVTVAMLVLPGLAFAQGLDVQPVMPGIWAIVGPTEQRSPDNHANNATFGLVETDAGAVLVDPGGSWAGAEALHGVVRGLTDQPVKYVINTGGQDHRWLGNGYWQAQGATVIASEAAVRDHKDRASLQMSALAQLLGDDLEGTEPSFADITFERDYRLDVGQMRFDIMHRGSAHTLGDSFVWLQAQEVMFTGDIVYVDRMLGIGPAGDSVSWLEVFDAMAAFGAKHIVPGHGRATDIAQARAETRDYLSYLRSEIAKVIEAGGSIEDGTHIDQSQFSYLAVFDQIARKNAQSVYMQMEWE
ncbi:MBL fold metallo-hydrolase [Pseudophaeobacter arcticus]|uniref:MBL fold metallo-hydrolase n=1 Tax=Pseudophaeobacter arcticus TaxID=385492 RepID=UPI0004002A6A|nr:MBL fold metallo-hydrolase [Pseudophaeobacter arcticus]